MIIGVFDQFRRRLQPGFLKDISSVGINGIFTDEKLPGYFLTCFPLNNEPDNLLFS